MLSDSALETFLLSREYANRRRTQQEITRLMRGNPAVEESLPVEVFPPMRVWEVAIRQHLGTAFSTSSSATSTGIISAGFELQKMPKERSGFNRSSAQDTSSLIQNDQSRVSDKPQLPYVPLSLRSLPCFGDASRCPPCHDDKLFLEVNRTDALFLESPNVLTPTKFEVPKEIRSRLETQKRLYLKEMAARARHAMADGNDGDDSHSGEATESSDGSEDEYYFSDGSTNSVFSASAEGDMLGQSAVFDSDRYAYLHSASARYEKFSAAQDGQLAKIHKTAISTAKTTADLHVLRSTFVDRMDTVPASELLPLSNQPPPATPAVFLRAQQQQQQKPRARHSISSESVVGRSRTASAAPQTADRPKVFADEDALIKSEAAKTITDEQAVLHPQVVSTSSYLHETTSRQRPAGYTSLGSNIVIFSKGANQAMEDEGDDDTDEGEGAFFFSMPRPVTPESSPQLNVDGGEPVKVPSPSPESTARRPSLANNVSIKKPEAFHITATHIALVQSMVLTASAMMRTAKQEPTISPASDTDATRPRQYSHPPLHPLQGSQQLTPWLDESPSVAALLLAYRAGNSKAKRSGGGGGGAHHEKLISHVTIKKEQGTNALVAPPSAALLAIPYEVQVNKAMYSQINLQRRVAVRRDENVKAALSKIWKALPKVYISEKGEGVPKPKSTVSSADGNSQPGSRLQPFINYHIYKWFARKLFTVLVVSPSVGRIVSSSSKSSSRDQLSLAHKAQKYDRQFESTISKMDWVRSWSSANYESLLTAIKAAESEAEEVAAMASEDQNKAAPRLLRRASPKRGKRNKTLPLPRLPHINTNRFLMDRRQFEFYLFLLADVWSESVLPSEYCDFINACFEVVFGGKGASSPPSDQPTEQAIGSARRAKGNTDYSGPITIYDRRMVAEIFDLQGGDLFEDMEANQAAEVLNSPTEAQSVDPKSKPQRSKAASSAIEPTKPKDSEATNRIRHKSKAQKIDDANFKLPGYCSPLPLLSSPDTAAAPPSGASAELALVVAAPTSPSFISNDTIALFQQQRSAQLRDRSARKAEKAKREQELKEKAELTADRQQPIRYKATRQRPLRPSESAELTSQRPSLQLSIGGTDSQADSASSPNIDSNRQSVVASVVASPLGRRSRQQDKVAQPEMNASEDRKSEERREKEKKRLLQQVKASRAETKDLATASGKLIPGPAISSAVHITATKAVKLKVEENIFAMLDHEQGMPFSTPIDTQLFGLDDGDVEVSISLPSMGEDDEERRRREFEALILAAEKQQDSEQSQQRAAIGQELEDAEVRGRQAAKAAIMAAAQKAKDERLRKIEEAERQAAQLLDGDLPTAEDVRTPSGGRRRSTVHGSRRRSSTFSSGGNSALVRRRSSSGSASPYKSDGVRSSDDDQNIDSDTKSEGNQPQSKISNRRHRRQDGLLSRLLAHKKTSGNNSTDEEVTYDALISERLMEESKLKREQYAQSVRAKRAEEKRRRDEERKAKEEAELKAQRRKLLAELEEEKLRSSGASGGHLGYGQWSRHKKSKEDASIQRAKERRQKMEEEQAAQLLSKLKGSKAMLADITSAEAAIQMAQNAGPLYHYHHYQNLNGGQLPRTPNKSVNSSIISDTGGQRSRPSSAPSTPRSPTLATPPPSPQIAIESEGNVMRVKSIEAKVPRPPAVPPTRTKSRGSKPMGKVPAVEFAEPLVEAKPSAPFGDAQTEVTTLSLADAPVPLVLVEAVLSAPPTLARELSTPDPGETTAPPTPILRSASASSEDAAEGERRFHAQQLALAVEVRKEQLFRQLPKPLVFTPEQGDPASSAAKDMVWESWVTAVAEATSESVMGELEQAERAAPDPMVLLLGGSRYYHSSAFDSPSFASSVGQLSTAPSLYSGACILSKGIEFLKGGVVANYGSLASVIASHQHSQLSHRSIGANQVRHFRDSVGPSTRHSKGATVDSKALGTLFAHRSSVRYLSLRIPVEPKTTTDGGTSDEHASYLDDALPYLRAIGWALALWAEGLLAETIADMTHDEATLAANRQFFESCLFPSVNTIELVLYSASSSLPVSSILAGTSPPSATCRMLLHSILASIAIIASRQPSIGVVRVDPTIPKLIDGDEEPPTNTNDGMVTSEVFGEFIDANSSQMSLVGALLDADGPGVELATSAAGYCPSFVLAEGSLMAAMGNLLVGSHLLGKRSWLRSTMDVTAEAETLVDVPCKLELHWCWQSFLRTQRTRFISQLPDQSASVGKGESFMATFTLRKAISFASKSSGAINTTALLEVSPAVGSTVHDVLRLSDIDDRIKKECADYLRGEGSNNTIATLAHIEKEFGGLWAPSAGSALLRPSVGVADTKSKSAQTSPAAGPPTPTSLQTTTSFLTVATSKGCRIAPLILNGNDTSEDGGAGSMANHGIDEELVEVLTNRLSPFISSFAHVEQVMADNKAHIIESFSEFLRALLTAILGLSVNSLHLPFISSQAVGAVLVHLCSVATQEPSLSSISNRQSVASYHLSTSSAAASNLGKVANLEALRASWKISSKKINPFISVSPLKSPNVRKDKDRLNLPATQMKAADTFLSHLALASAPVKDSAAVLVARAPISVTSPPTDAHGILKQSALPPSDGGPTSIRSNTMLVFAPQITVTMPSLVDLTDFLLGCRMGEERPPPTVGRTAFSLTLWQICKGMGISPPPEGTDSFALRSVTNSSHNSSVDGPIPVRGVPDTILQERRFRKLSQRFALWAQFSELQDRLTASEFLSFMGV